MAEAAQLPIAGVAPREHEVIRVPEDVTFPELVWSHHLRQLELHNPGADAYAGPAEQRYRVFRKRFEALHGRVVDEFWCSGEASAVVVAMKPAVAPLRWLGKDPSARIYSATTWTTRELPVAVAELVSEADALAMRAREVLRGTAQRLVIQRLFNVTAYLLGTFEGTSRSQEETTGAVESVSGEIAEIRQEYVTAATRSAQIVYFWGMVAGLVCLSLLTLIVLPVLAALSTPRWAIEGFYGCAIAGGLGAMVSVVARMNASSFKLEYDVGRPTLRRLGAFRPLVGAVFGVVIYLALVSHLMHIDVAAGDRQFAFFVVWAFIAGFSERFVRDTIDGIQASVGGAKPAAENRPTTNEPEDSSDADVRGG
jgi:hypothetical protein